MLTACDREPIHRPDAIQSYGLLLIADASTLTVLGGAGDLEGRLSGEWLGRSLPELLGLPPEGFQDFTPASFSDARISGLQGETFSLLIHPTDGKLLVELEPIQEARLLTWEIFGRIDATADRFERCPDVAEVCRQGAKVFRKLTGFDRVMVYRFQEDGSGCVVGEHRNEIFPSLLNHHFPASD
ncbi:histidine kinase, partial [Gluconobacter japonicus]